MPVYLLFFTVPKRPYFESFLITSVPSKTTFAIEVKSMNSGNQTQVQFPAPEFFYRSHFCHRIKFKQEVTIKVDEKAHLYVYPTSQKNSKAMRPRVGSNHQPFG